jgi:hypothetical protein
MQQTEQAQDEPRARSGRRAAGASCSPALCWRWSCEDNGEVEFLLALTRGCAPYVLLGVTPRPWGAPAGLTAWFQGSGWQYHLSNSSHR